MMNSEVSVVAVAWCSVLRYLLGGKIFNW